MSQVNVVAISALTTVTSIQGVTEHCSTESLSGFLGMHQSYRKALELSVYHHVMRARVACGVTRTPNELLVFVRH